MSHRYAIFLSLAIHLLLGFGLSRAARYYGPAARPFVLELAAPTEQEKQDARKALEKGLKQVVRQAEIPESLKTKRDRPARFFSERDQSVLQETRATASGLTQNRAESAPGNRPGIPGLAGQGGVGEAGKSAGREAKPPQRRLELKPEKLIRGAGDVAAGPASSEPRPTPIASGASRPLQLPNFARLGGLERGESTVGENLPSDVKFGNMTALNTDRYVHYSFYARFEELFRHRWVKYVRSALFSYQNAARVSPREQNWTTRLEIVLNPQGRFIRGILHDGSGFKALDAAPVEAMQEVAQIPNPPSEMVRPDGTVRLMYEFNVQFVPQYAGVQ